jgi:hypothetical protein
LAILNPRTLSVEIRRDPSRDGECLVFDALSRLPSDYRVFYSVAWLARSRRFGGADGEADFVIVHPQRGAIVVEVKGGIIRRDGEAGKWFSAFRSTGKEVEIKDPVAQAKRNKFRLSDALVEQSTWVSGKPKFGHAVAFPHCDAYSQALGPDCPAEIVMYAPDLADIERWANQVYDFWSGSEAPCSPFDGISMRTVTNLFVPRVSLSSASDVASINHSENEIERLTTNQLNILNSLSRNRRVAIRGGAGTGKTVLALTKAVHLANQGFQVLLTCYNKPLADHLESLALSTPGLRVSTFHALCTGIIRDAGLKTQRSNDRTYWDDVLPNALGDALSKRQDIRFDAIVVDEGQDFAESWWTPLQLALSDPDDGIMYVFYDDNQRLYQRPNGYPKDLVDFCLSENLRNTKPIHAAAAYFYSGGDLRGIGPDGPSISTVTVPDPKAERLELAKFLERLVNQEHVAPNKIAVLLGRSVEANGIAASGLIGTVRCTRDASGRIDRPLLESIARFKGLERPVILLADLGHSVDGTHDEDLYVGLSRARSLLFVFGSEQVLHYMGLSPKGATAAKPGLTDYQKALSGEL